MKLRYGNQLETSRDRHLTPCWVRPGEEVKVLSNVRCVGIGQVQDAGYGIDFRSRKCFL